MSSWANKLVSGRGDSQSKLPAGSEANSNHTNTELDRNVSAAAEAWPTSERGTWTDSKRTCGHTAESTANSMELHNPRKQETMLQHWCLIENFDKSHNIKPTLTLWIKAEIAWVTCPIGNQCSCNPFYFAGCLLAVCQQTNIIANHCKLAGGTHGHWTLDYGHLMSHVLVRGLAWNGYIVLPRIRNQNQTTKKQ